MTTSDRRVWWVVGIGALLGGAVALLWPRSAFATTGGTMTLTQIQNLILDVFRGSGIPLWFAMANANLESAFNPNAHRGGNESSWGLMQINWNAHEAALRARGIESPQELTDPLVNLTYWRDLVGRLASQEGATESGGIEDWGRVRLRLAGVRRSAFGGATAARILGRFRPVAARWLARGLQ